MQIKVERNILAGILAEKIYSLLFGELNIKYII